MATVKLGSESEIAICCRRQEIDIFVQEFGDGRDISLPCSQIGSRCRSFRQLINIVFVNSVKKSREPRCRSTGPLLWGNGRIADAALLQCRPVEVADLNNDLRSRETLDGHFFRSSIDFHGSFLPDGAALNCFLGLLRVLLQLSGVYRARCLSHLSSLLLQLVHLSNQIKIRSPSSAPHHPVTSDLTAFCLCSTYNEQTGIQETLDTVAKARLFATTEAGTDGRLDALIPATVCEGVDGRLYASLGLLGVEERLQLCVCAMRRREVESVWLLAPQQTLEQSCRGGGCGDSGNVPF